MARIRIKRQIILLADNIRSAHNVGSLFRTAEGLGVSELILTGYSPFPRRVNDNRLEHIIGKLDKQIEKTALGAQSSLKWHYANEAKEELHKYRKKGFKVYALEQHRKSQSILNVKAEDKIVIIVGNEVSGIDADLLNLSDGIVEIPMLGKKESFNVVQAAAMALFYFRLIT